ncbi:MAG TPA: putative lipid II flippase FtsW [Gammaproteobacteria bacterium]|nr:putative lipid II flippase FtsW [Gammaproteobacteria bacterium]
MIAAPSETRTLAFDPALACALVVLAVLGAIMVGSASITIADRQTHGAEPLAYLIRHLGALALGGVAMAVAMSVPTELWYRLNWLLLVAALALLVIVLAPGIGHTVNGSRRWILVGPVTLQASEPARLCLLLYLASYSVRRADALASSLQGLLKPLLVIGAAAGLLLLEPDFGAAVVLTATSFGVLFVAGARLRDFLLAAGAGGALLGALAFSSPYRLERLTKFLDPWADPYAGGFQLTQSLIAIGRGEWLGVGLGESVQKLFYLPEAHTDFVFAVLVEELGFVGASLVIALFAVIVYRAVMLGRDAIRSGLPFQAFVATGIGLMLGFEAFVNIGVNAGLLPTKGLPLPLLSYGRSSTITTMLALGLLFRIYREVHGGQKRFVQRGYVR